MRDKRFILMSFLILSAVVFLSGQEVVEEIVAVVNDEIITFSDYKAQHDALYQALRAQSQGEDYEEKFAVIKKELLNSMITDMLLIQEARKREINPSEQVKLAIENIKGENNMTSDDELIQAMRSQGIDFRVWKKQLEEYYLKQSVIVMEVDRSISLDESEVVNHYKLHQKEFTEPVEYKLRAIYLSEENRNEEEIEARKREVRVKLDGGEEFAVLAGQYTEGPEKETQGDLGSIKEGEMEKNLLRAVKELKKGEMTPWIKVRNGWYLLKLEEKKESRVKTFEEVRKQIEEKLFLERREKKLETFLKELKEKSYIKILKSNPLDLGDEN